MRTIICGSRSYAKQKPDETLDVYLNRIRFNEDTLRKELDNFLDSTTVVLSGLAKGPDLWGKEWGEKNGIVVLDYPPDWKRFGKGAGFRRNEEMVGYADRVIAFYNGFSRGTSHTVRLAREAGLEVFEFINILKT